MLLCGHRGLASLAPENTLSGLDAAHKQGLTWVEIDVQLTQDNQVVLFHDERLHRCTNGRGLLREHSWQQLSRLDAGRWFSAEFASERLVLLHDYLTHAARLNIKVNIELKLYPKDNAANLSQQVSRVISCGAFAHANLLFSSFEPNSLVQMQRLQPTIARALLVERIPTDWHAALQRLDCAALNCNHRHLTQAQAQAVNAAGYQLNCYTVNSQRQADTLASWGVNMIFTDKPLRQAPGAQHQAPS
ncbi:glycerophosphodiester phosphodiesterase family protein [Oceanisphaera ostreae]|uniref:Glycerophosphodiester phosphodiesterase family protein n=1 Tax=Oceanisphaera ostreae TaxID=914151 RepID=A0ABW3KF80_9GAMM